MKTLSIPRLATIAVLALALQACAAAVPGYAPPDQKPSLLSRVKPFESGGMAAGGIYAPSEAEQKLDCRHLTGSMKIMIARQKAVANRPLPSAAATTLQSAAAATIGGSTAGLDVAAEAARERARLEAYNRLLAEKKCKTLDIAAELAAKP